MEKYIRYVSTNTNGQVLGIEEQKSRIHQFIESGSDKLFDIIMEQGTGNNNRKGLEVAINLCIGN